jgi:CBS domain-containing protein
MADPGFTLVPSATFTPESKSRRPGAYRLIRRNSVDVGTSLFVVASLMAEKRVGSVLVTELGRLTGIFTTTDACRVLAELLHPDLNRSRS